MSQPQNGRSDQSSSLTRSVCVLVTLRLWSAADDIWGDGASAGATRRRCLWVCGELRHQFVLLSWSNTNLMKLERTCIKFWSPWKEKQIIHTYLHTHTCMTSRWTSWLHRRFCFTTPHKMWRFFNKYCTFLSFFQGFFSHLLHNGFREVAQVLMYSQSKYNYCN